MSGNNVPCILCHDTEWCTKNGCRMERDDLRKPPTPEPPGANTVIVRSNVTELADRRPPVNYTIEISQKWDGGYSLYVNNVSDSDRSREAVRDMLLRIAEDIKSGELFA
jgi:hypothetical protein